MRKLLFTVLLTSLANTAFAKEVEYNLIINREPVTITDRTANKITVNGTIPGPTLRFDEGDEAIIHVTNKMQEETSVHWHGLLLPGEMDGVPGFNKFPGIMPSETFTYRFKIRQSGTYWYHAHSAEQEQDGHYGSIVINPGSGELKTERDYVVLISDFKDDESGNSIMANLKKSADYYQYARRTIGDFFTDAREQGFGKAWEDAKMWGDMRMRPTDLADVSGYTFLTNGKPPEQSWTGLFRPGERVRLRFINASAMSFFDVRIPGLKMTVVSADGQNVEPVPVDEFRFGAAETYDVIVTPQEDKAYTIAAESIDRTGFAIGTLAPREGMKGEIPTHRPRALLTMADMGMNHEGHDMASMDSASETSGNVGHSMHNMPGMDHAAMGHQMPAENAKEKDYETGTKGSGWADAGTPSGERALKYKDLRYFGIQKDVRQPGREITVKLGGNMERFIWTINGKKFSDAGPIHLNYGERVRLTFVNDTMMAHPMHLHGMFVQLENGQPAEKLPNKHTVVVAPGDTYSVLLTADEAGEWAFHCHLLYHMMAGMMNKVIVAKLDPSQVPAEHQGHQMPADHSNMNHTTEQPKPAAKVKPAAAKQKVEKNTQQMDRSKMNHSGHDMPEVKRQPEKPKSLPTPTQNHGEHNAH